VDLWLIETQSSTREAEVAIAASQRVQLPTWISYTLRDELGRQGPAQLRSGESVEEAVTFAIQHGAEAVLFNCSQPEVMNDAVLAAAGIIASRSTDAVQIGVYANAFMPEANAVEPYAGISEMRGDLDPERYLKYAAQWVKSGATIVGGCCGIGPEHITALREYFR
jgi:S-methylmethionine-dependent homocysteine/selenocysteine methylase